MYCVIAAHMSNIAAGSSSQADFETLLPAIEYPLGVCLRAGASRNKTPGIYWVLPCDARSGPSQSDVKYEVRAEASTAGPRCVKVQRFTHGERRNNTLKPNGAGWAVRKSRTNVPTGQSGIHFECMFVTQSPTSLSFHLGADSY